MNLPASELIGQAGLSLARTPTEGLAKAWPWAAALAVAGILWLLGWYGDTVGAAVSIWLRSDTYAHGLLIVPITLYLIWRQRNELVQLKPRAHPLGLLALGAAGAFWLVARLANVDAAQQLAVVLLMISLVWAVLGTTVVRKLAFPLAFLLLAVPFGEFLLPPLMSFTADFTVAALRLTGIPVFREGNFFTIPTGNWSVVEACSGLRYLIASFTLGCLFAYLTYRSTRRRLIFVAMSIIVPIIANGIRAYMIVMIGHLSDMKLAVGVDHLIYGWVFFGIVMMLLFWVGSMWREDRPEDGAAEVVATGAGEAKSAGPVRLGAVAAYAALAAVLSALWPVLADRLVPSQPGSTALTLSAPASDQGWSKSDQPVSTWRPQFLYARGEYLQTYARDGRRVSLQAKFYRNQQQDTELINARNEVAPSANTTWSKVGDGIKNITLGNKQIAVSRSVLRSSDTHLLVWHWYWINGEPTSSPAAAKLLQAKATLLERRDDSAAIFVSTAFESDAEEAEHALEEFVIGHGAAIDESLRVAKR